MKIANSTPRRPMHLAEQKARTRAAETARAEAVRSEAASAQVPAENKHIANPHKKASPMVVKQSRGRFDASGATVRAQMLAQVPASQVPTSPSPEPSLARFTPETSPERVSTPPGVALAPGASASALAPGEARAPSPGTAVDGPGITPPGTRILDHDWVQSSELGDAKIEEIYAPVSAWGAWRSKTLANVALGTDLDAPATHETQAIRFSYNTQDRGEIVRATGVMVVPVTNEPQEMPMLLTLHGYGGMNNESAPSTGWDDGENAQYQKLTSVIASSGKIVVMPDYIGINGNGEDAGQHPFLVAEPTAVASLDAVRAARNILTQMNENPQEGPHTEVTPGETVVWGGSQGGHAAAAVARYQPDYAPDVPLRAVGMGAPPLDVRRQTQDAVANETSVYHAGAIYMGMADYYDVPMKEVFQGEYAEKIPEIFANGSPEEVQANLEGLSMREVLQPDVYAAAMNPSLDPSSRWSNILSENSLNTSQAIPPSSGTPMHMAIGDTDELVRPGISRDTFQSLVDQNENVRLLECKGADHNQGAFLRTLDDSLAFLDQALANEDQSRSIGEMLRAQDCKD